MSSAEVVSYIHALHGVNTTIEERKQADRWLRLWQHSSEAWHICNQLLSSNEYEVQQTAASTVRIKVMYDFFQLPKESHEILCQSIINHIKKLQAQTSHVVITSLALALADLSMHTCKSWMHFFKTMSVNLFPHVDIQTLLICLKVFPEENLNENVLVDVGHRYTHATVLREELQWVVTKLENILQSSVNNNDTSVKVLECFTEWISFEASFPQRSSIVSINDCILSKCFELIALSGCEAAANCLIEILYIASQDSKGYKNVLEKALHELASDNGCLRLALAKAVMEDNKKLILMFSRIYRYASLGLIDKIVLYFHQEQIFKDLVLILLQLTSFKFSFTEECSGLNGIAEQILDFWIAFSEKTPEIRQEIIEKFHEQDLCVTNKQFEGTVCASVREKIQKNNPEENKLILEQQNLIFNLVITTLTKLCILPPELINDPFDENDVDEFLIFRSEVCRTLCWIARVVSLHTLLNTLLMRIAEASCARNFIEEEAYIACLGSVIRRVMKKSHQNAASIFQQSVNIQALEKRETEEMVVLASFITFLQSIHTILTPQILASQLEAHLRISACTLIEESVKVLPISLKKPLMPLFLECLGYQIFVTNLDESSITGEGPQDTKNTTGFSPATNGRNMGNLLNDLRNSLSEYASAAFLAVCTECSYNAKYYPDMAQHLVTAVNKYQNINRKSYENVLQGVSIFVVSTSNDPRYLVYLGELLEAAALSILSSDISKVPLCLDRLSLIFKFLIPEETSVTPSEVIGEFLVFKVWPIIEHLMKLKADNVSLVEKCSRTLKHGMRCVKGKLFAPLVQPLTSLVMSNCKNVCVLPCYFYMAEWLLTEYSTDGVILKHLETLFNDLSLMGLNSIVNLVSDIKPTDEGFLIEDWYGMFCRYLRYAPIIPGNSDLLPRAFEIGYPALHHHNPDLVLMICSFFDSVAHIKKTHLRGIRNEEESTHPDDKDRTLAREANAFKRISSLFDQNLGKIIEQYFAVIQSVPVGKILDKIIRSLEEMLNCVEWGQFECALKEALSNIPPSLQLSENSLEKMIEDFSNGYVKPLLMDLNHRCRQVLLRKQEVEMLK